VETPSHIPPFEDYIAQYRGIFETLQKQLAKSKLSMLEDIACRYMYSLEFKLLDLKEGNEQTFLTDILVKATTEMFASVGVLRHGTFLPAYHHTRSIFELYAALEHMYSIPAKKQRRLDKYIEFPNLAKFLHYRDLKRELDAGSINEKEFSESCVITETEFNELGTRKTEWNRIWRLKDEDPGKVQNWHYPTTIEGLFRSSDTTRIIWNSYKTACHATHLSPLGRRIAPGNHLIGFPRDSSGVAYSKINLPIVYSILAAQTIAIFLETKLKAGTVPGVLEYGVINLRYCFNR
jgi:hypothetical protein